ncbi:mitochondrial 54S ribosomal mL60 domain-containing protein Ecym_6095 [Eremothecium cymbalariae DBVPG|uniref:54S ribosomal protein L31, mitochondrial n=1 Tax=Eremothecium cymbalariae (strain CBS 270.75 / DBVPG 7215 / KCTC 17166 / NRRL Y-17582) TaxID=931890 RepID=G8JV12_ERECY|nr:hypothetical protein Ecym_6095 [Eremothecium cymbalariae DBVPG\
MFGPFRSSQPLLGGLLWKIPWRMSTPQKQRQRKRLKAVDKVLSQLNLGLYIKSAIEKNPAATVTELLHVKNYKYNGIKQLNTLNDPSVFPSESQMSYKDKYTIFNRYSKQYRKGIHKVPKWTKVSNRSNPKNF